MPNTEIQTEIQPRLVAVVHPLGFPLPHQNNTENEEMNEDIYFLRDLEDFSDDYPIDFVGK